MTTVVKHPNPSDLPGLRRDIQTIARALNLNADEQRADIVALAALTTRVETIEAVPVLTLSTITGTLPVASGGTGATTAADARTNLGVAATSHSHAWSDITSGKPTTLAGYGITDAPHFTSGAGAPGAGTLGDLYYDTTNHRIYWYDGAWYYVAGTVAP